MEHALSHLEAEFVEEYKKAEIFSVDSFRDLEAEAKKLLAWIAGKGAVQAAPPIEVIPAPIPESPAA